MAIGAMAYLCVYLIKKPLRTLKEFNGSVRSSCSSKSSFSFYYNAIL